MDIKDLIAKAFDGPAFVDEGNSGAKSLDEFQEIVQLARAAEAQGLLATVFLHPLQEPGRYDLLYLTGATESGRSLLRKA